jgi:hypothetical protein
MMKIKHGWKQASISAHNMLGLAFENRFNGKVTMITPRKIGETKQICYWKFLTETNQWFQNAHKHNKYFGLIFIEITSEIEIYRFFS